MLFKCHRKVLLASAVALASHASLLQAAGFTINEHGGSAMGTAFAGRATHAEDASVGASNPAAIALLERGQVTVGSAVIMESGNFENGSYTTPNSYTVPESSTKSDNFFKTSPVPFAHIVVPIDDKFFLGLNAYVPFGLNLDYDDKFAGRYFGDKTSIKTVNIQTTFAYKIQDNLSIGVGLTASYIEGEITKKSHAYDTRANNIDSKVTGDDLAFTWNLGVTWQPIENTILGASYHAETKFKLSGDVEVNTNIALINGYKHKAALDITMPERVMLSATHHLNEQWTVMADATWTRWSRLENLTIMDKDIGGPVNYTPMDWNDVWSFSLGTAYQIDDQWTVKAGYMFDESPASDKTRTARSPDNDRHWVTAGVKWDTSADLTFDFSAAYVMMKDGKISQQHYNANTKQVDTAYGTFTGDYKDQATWILAAQMNYRF